MLLRAFHSSMFLKLDRNTSGAILFLLKVVFIILLIESTVTLRADFSHFFRDVIHDFYPNLENSPLPIKALALLLQMPSAGNSL